MIVRLALNGAAHFAAGAVIGALAYLAYKRDVFGAVREAAMAMPVSPERARPSADPANTDA